MPITLSRLSLRPRLRRGDRVRRGPNLFPHYEVMAVVGPRVWLRDLQTGADALGPVAGLSRLPPDAPAA